MNQTNLNFPVYTSGVPCTTIGLHFRPHEDEIACLAFLKHHGEKVHPGIGKAIESKKFIFFDAGSVLPGNQKWQDLHQKGIVLIGVGGSPYDEHNLSDELKKTECAATLVARAIGIDKDIRYTRLINELLINDRNPQKSLLSTSSSIRAGHILFSQNIDGMKEVITYTMASIEWQMMLQQTLFDETKKDFEKNARIVTVKYRNNDIKIVSIISSNEQIATYAKIAEKPQMTICFNKDRGHVYISAAKIINLGSISKRIRSEEMRILGIKFDSRDPKLFQDGIYPGLEQWHFQSEANCLMNGSLTAPNKKATRIPFEKIEGIILNYFKNATSPATLGSLSGMKDLKQKFA